MTVRWEYIKKIIPNPEDEETIKLNAWIVTKLGQMISPIFTNRHQCEVWKEENAPNELVDFTRVNDEIVRQRNKQP